MDLLADTQTRGRWIIAPRKGERFLGRQGRARARARERRRRVLAFLLEAIALTFLIGLVPPLHRMWILTGMLAGLLAVYLWALLRLRDLERERSRTRRALEEHDPSSGHPVTERHVAEGRSRLPRPVYNGLGSLDEGDRVHVVVRSAAELEAANA